MEVGEEWRRRVCGCMKEKTLKNVVTSNLPLIFTKLPLWAPELQKCHYWALNVAHSLR